MFLFAYVGFVYEAVRFCSNISLVWPRIMQKLRMCRLSLYVGRS